MTHVLTPSERWGQFPLFRLLMFLDATGMQSFDAAVEVDPDSGCFLRPQHLISSSLHSSIGCSEKKMSEDTTTTALGSILQCVAAAFRENLFYLCCADHKSVSDGEEEARSFLCAFSVATNDPEKEIKEEAGSPIICAEDGLLFENPTSVACIEEVLDSHLTLLQRLRLLQLFCGTSTTPQTTKRKGKKKSTVQQAQEEVETLASSTPSNKTKVESQNDEKELAISLTREDSLTDGSDSGACHDRLHHSDVQLVAHSAVLSTTSSANFSFSCCRSPSNALVEQLLIDGLDRWLRAPLCVDRSLSLDAMEDVTGHYTPSSESFISSPSPLQRMVLACGGVLSPEVVLPLLATQEGVSILIEFVLDVLFPLPLSLEEVEEMHRQQSSCSKAAPQKTKTNREALNGEKEAIKKGDADSTTSSSLSPSLVDWLRLTYHTNREVEDRMPKHAVKKKEESESVTARGTVGTTKKREEAKEEVCVSEADESIIFLRSGGSEKSSSETDASVETMTDLSPERMTTKKRRKTEGNTSSFLEAVAKDDKGLDGWTPPDDGEVYLTSAMIDSFMREHPEKLPRSVVVEKRRKISDPQLTQRELENHYTAAELRCILKDLIREREDSNEWGSPLSDAMNELSVKEWDRIKKATKKVEFVHFLIRLYKRKAKKDTLSK